MQINQHNYEEFFLMYVDNELSVPEKEMVEAFIIQHPELAAELELLKQTVLNIEEPVDFAGKEKLIRRPELTEEELLVYLDGEAGKELAGTIEQAAKSNDAVKLELETLRKLYLKADLSVQYPAKEKLYKRGAVRSMDWRKLAIAASLLLCVSTWLVLDQSEQEEQDGAPVAFNPTPVNRPAEAEPAVVDTNVKVNIPVIAEPRSREENPGNVMRETKTFVKINSNSRIKTPSSLSEPLAGKREKNIHTPTIIESGNINRTNQPLQSTEPAKVIPEPVTKSPALEQSNSAVASVKEPVKEKKSLFKKIKKQISDRALDILSDGGDNINVAGFAIRVEK